jgi:hypothetical protein
MRSTKVEAFAEGNGLPVDANDGERAIAALVAKTTIAPAMLGPADLHDVTMRFGTTAAVDITGYLYSFHFINRIADLVGIQSDLPLIQPHWAWLRRMGVRLQGAMMRRGMDLSRQEVSVDVDAAVNRLSSFVGTLPRGFVSLHNAPNVAGILDTVCDVVSCLNQEMFDRVGDLVRSALPANEEEATGIHTRPADPLEALVFVGTRYPARTTDDLVARVRQSEGLDDRGVLDLFYSISVHNGLERMRRLLAEPVVVMRRGEVATTHTVTATGR